MKGHFGGGGESTVYVGLEPRGRPQEGLSHECMERSEWMDWG